MSAANPNIHYPPSDPLCQASCRESEYPRELVYSLVGLRKLTPTYRIGSSSPQQPDRVSCLRAILQDFAPLSG